MAAQKMIGHELYRVTEFKIVGPYTLSITFDDESCQTINFEPILYGNIYGPLRDLKLFNRVRLDPEVHTLVWPNDADFDPETLRNWPDYKDAWIEAAKRWALVVA
ncbi:MAG: DUF2442 domain-containing protein [Caldilineaceae bacterium]